MHSTGWFTTLEYIHVICEECTCWNAYSCEMIIKDTAAAIGIRSIEKNLYYSILFYWEDHDDGTHENNRPLFWPRW